MRNTFLTFIGVFSLLANQMTVTHRNSKAKFSSSDVDSAFTIRLLTTVTEYQRKKLKDYWKSDSNLKVELPLGADSFQLINAHIHGPDDLETVYHNETKLLNLIMCNFRSIVAPDNIFCFDELVMSHTSATDPLVAYIPRKPHPEGIVVYLAACRLAFSKFPFVVYIAPVTSSAGLSGPHAFQSFLNSVKNILGQLPHNDIHVVVDALFPTTEAIATASSFDIRVTWSQNKAHQTDMFEVLSDGLAKGQWRTALLPDANAIPSHFFVFNDSKAMMGGSTGFQTEEVEILFRNGCTPSIARDLSRLNKESLTWLVSILPNASLNTCGSNISSMVFDKEPWIGDVGGYNEGLLTVYFPKDQKTYNPTEKIL